MLSRWNSQPRFLEHAGVITAAADPVFTAIDSAHHKVVPTLEVRDSVKERSVADIEELIRAAYGTHWMREAYVAVGAAKRVQLLAQLLRIAVV
jgi:hypothetical protein